MTSIVYLPTGHERQKRQADLVVVIDDDRPLETVLPEALATLHKEMYRIEKSAYPPGSTATETNSARD